ncbi:glycosyltransferase family 2 protein [Oribacterium sp. P6A1]|uniref:glycosyltransferase family 2 protein n=1 Tax=Oribacterium sp. P6A1 TaxID=1410612 RepID=UPI00068C0C5A|nr:glycosyltransferase family 2 protein [Oribacterium sp. P6A1]
MDYQISISVIMATYNTEISVLKEAVDSILNQTFNDFEFIIIDDGSNNGSYEYLSNIKDNRVSIIKNKINLGITKSLNIGIKKARGKYIARMDADDISLPERLEKEFLYMENHHDVVLCGSRMASVNREGQKIGDLYIPRYKNMKEYHVKLLFKNPGPAHPTVMIRHETLSNNNITYDERLIYAQDYGMWEELSHYGKIHVLKKVLLYRRKHEKQISVEKRDIQIKCDQNTQKKLLSVLLGKVTDEEVIFHYMHSTGYYHDVVITPEVLVWYDRLIQANKSRQIYDQRYLEKNIVNIKKLLIINSFKPGMSLFEKMKIIFRYLPFCSGIRMVGGCIKRMMTEKTK